MSFHVGQKVVCVDDRPRKGYLPLDPDEAVHIGKIYTITRIFSDEFGIGFHLAEVARNRLSQMQWGGLAGYGSWRFRPLIDRKTDISIFMSLLDPANHKPLPEQQPDKPAITSDA